MFRALAAWHSAWLSLLPGGRLGGELAAGAVPPLAIVRYWLAIASYRPSSAEVFGGIPLRGQDEGRGDVGQALLLGRGHRRRVGLGQRLPAAWAVETVMPA